MSHFKEAELLGQNEWFPFLPWIDEPTADVNVFVNSYRKPYGGNLMRDLSNWRRSGYIVIQGAADLSLVDSFVEELEQLRNNLHGYLLPLEIRGKQTWSRAIDPKVIDDPSVKLNHLHVASLYAARLSLSKPIIDFLHSIFLAPPVPMQSLTFFKGSQQRTHIDYPYVKVQRRLPVMAASWIALEDVHWDAGPLEYYPGGHNPEVSGFFDWGSGNIVPSSTGQDRTADEFSDFLERRLAENQIERLPFLARKGDIIIWHANLPHRGRAVVNNLLTRKSYVTHYTGLFDYPKGRLPKSKRDHELGISENGAYLFEFPWDSEKVDAKLPSWAGRSGLCNVSEAHQILAEGEEAYKRNCRS